MRVNLCCLQLAHAPCPAPAPLPRENYTACIARTVISCSNNEPPQAWDFLYRAFTRPCSDCTTVLTYTHKGSDLGYTNYALMQLSNSLKRRGAGYTMYFAVVKTPWNQKISGFGNFSNCGPSPGDPNQVEVWLFPHTWAGPQSTCPAWHL